MKDVDREAWVRRGLLRSHCPIVAALACAKRSMHFSPPSAFGPVLDAAFPSFVPSTKMLPKTWQLLFTYGRDWHWMYYFLLSFCRHAAPNPVAPIHLWRRNLCIKADNLAVFEPLFVPGLAIPWTFGLHTWNLGGFCMTRVQRRFAFCDMGWGLPVAICPARVSFRRSDIHHECLYFEHEHLFYIKTNFLSSRCMMKCLRCFCCRLGNPLHV